MLLLFNSVSDNSDYSFKKDKNTTTHYSLPYDIAGDDSENYPKTYITSGFSVKELSNGIGLLVRLRKNVDTVSFGR